MNTQTCLPAGGPHIVGILNVTPDSFSDGGEFAAVDAAALQYHRMAGEGASVIDVGGESTRPGHRRIGEEEEIRRVVPVIERCLREGKVPVSVDTSKAAVAEAALGAGASIVNDVWGFQRDPEIAAVAASHGAACFLMHNRPAEEAGGGDVIEAIRRFLEGSVAIAVGAGIPETAIVLDPGIGFGKTVDENWEILRRLDELVAIGFPILLGASRKSFLGKRLGIGDQKERLAATLATTALAVRVGVRYIRVHDVRENLDAARVAAASTG